jgi:hypothetical protein
MPLRGFPGLEKHGGRHSMAIQILEGTERIPKRSHPDSEKTTMIDNGRSNYNI